MARAALRGCCVISGFTYNMKSNIYELLSSVSLRVFKMLGERLAIVSKYLPVVVCCGCCIAVYGEQPKLISIYVA